MSPVSPELIKIIECPRDAWQAMPQQIPAQVKANYLRRSGRRRLPAYRRRLFRFPVGGAANGRLGAGAGSAWPGFAAEIIGIVVNEPGADRAIATGAVRTLGFPYSISATFLERNQKQTLQTARQTLEKIYARAARAGLGVVAYLSMAFGNPYGDPWLPEDVMAACLTLKELGIKQISLADTVGLANPEQIESLVSGVLTAVPGIELGAHLHARPEQAAEKIAAAYRAGCRRLDMALGGQGGCPFAQDALVGNVATEAAVAELSKLGAELPRLRPLEELLAMSDAIADRFGRVG